MSQYEIVDGKDPLFGFVQGLLKTISFPEPGVMRLVPTGNNWAVNLIRHRKSHAFQIGERYVLTSTTVAEFKVKYIGIEKGKVLAINFDSLTGKHMEVEVIICSYSNML